MPPVYLPGPGEDGNIFATSRRTTWFSTDFVVLNRQTIGGTAEIRYQTQARHYQAPRQPYLSSKVLRTRAMILCVSVAISTGWNGLFIRAKSVTQYRHKSQSQSRSIHHIQDQRYPHSNEASLWKTHLAGTGSFRR